MAKRPSKTKTPEVADVPQFDPILGTRIEHESAPVEDDVIGGGVVYPPPHAVVQFDELLDLLRNCEHLNEPALRGAARDAVSRVKALRDLLKV